MLDPTRLVRALTPAATLALALFVTGCCCPSGDYESSGGGGGGDYGSSSGDGVEIKRKDLGMVCATHATSSSGLTIPAKGDKETGPHAETSELVRELIADLGENAGLRRKSIPPVFSDPGVGGSVAVAATLLKPYAGYPKGQRLILYSPADVNRHTKKSGTTGTISFIFAHELGHHVNGHNVARPGASSHEKELEADYYAGFLMGLGGDRLRDTTAWINTNVGDRDSPSHPGKTKRLKAAREGWEKACAQVGHCNK